MQTRIRIQISTPISSLKSRVTGKSWGGTTQSWIKTLKCNLSFALCLACRYLLAKLYFTRKRRQFLLNFVLSKPSEGCFSHSLGPLFPLRIIITSSYLLKISPEPLAADTSPCGRLCFSPECTAGLRWRLNGKEYTCQFRRCRFNPWVGKIP